MVDESSTDIAEDKDSESSPGNAKNPCYQSKAKNYLASIYNDMDRYSNIKPNMMETEVGKPHMPGSFTVWQAADYEETIFT